MFVTNWISTTKIQKISEITNFFRHYFLSRTEVYIMRRASFEVSTCIVRCENVHRSTHVLTSFGVSRKTNRQYTSFPAGMSVYCLL